MDGDLGDRAGRAPQRPRSVERTGVMSDQTPRVAVITGASQGIGASLVPAYRKLGYAVLGTSRTMGPSDDPMIATVQGDIATADTAERVTRHAIDRFGRIDTLINNAGVFVAKRFTQYTDEDYELLTGVNLAGFFHITRRAIEHMEGVGSGHVVNITTTLVEHADAKVPSALASLTKGGLAAVTRSLATEYAATGNPRQRGVPGRDQDTDARTGDP